jgi:hypothetical protein
MKRIATQKRASDGRRAARWSSSTGNRKIPQKECAGKGCDGQGDGMSPARLSQKQKTQPQRLGHSSYFQHSKSATLNGTICRLSILRHVLRLRLIVAIRNIDM